MEKADQLIKKIDDELLYLYEASLKNKDYYHFNFELALRQLNVEMLRLRSKEFYQMKASQYISVFNDLCNTIVYTIFVRFLSFDPIDGILVIEEQERSILGSIEAPTFKEKYMISGESLNYFSKLSYPTVFNESRKICKFDNLISYCKSVSNQKNDSVFFYNSFGYPLLKHLIQNEKFDDFFDIDPQLIKKHKTTFEEYIHYLIDVKSLESEISEQIDIENIVNNDMEKIEILIKKLIPTFINQEQEQELRNLLTKGRIKNNRIDIKGKYITFHNTIYPFKDVIPKSFYTSWYDLIVNNFTRKGKDIPKSTISNPKNSNNLN